MRNTILSRFSNSRKSLVGQFAESEKNPSDDITGFAERVLVRRLFHYQTLYSPQFQNFLQNFGKETFDAYIITKENIHRVPKKMSPRAINAPP